jgi:hypothetical protein
MHPRSALLRRFCWGLAAALALQSSLAQAEMLGPEAALVTQAPSEGDAERARLQQFLESASLKERLQTLGVDGLNAKARVDAMTQEEVHALVQRIDSMPAGGALSDRDIILILLVALLLVVAL